MIPNIAVVIASYQGQEFLPRAFESLRGQTLPPTSIIIVDNGSTDQTLDILRLESETLPIDTVPLRENLGFGVANNIGIQRALASGADYVFLMNQDIILHANTLSILVDTMAKHPTCGILSAIQLTYDGKALDPYFGNNFPKGVLGDYILGRQPDYYRVLFAPAAAVLIPSDALRQVGGFDPLFFLYGEDQDLCRRFLAAGWQLGIATKAMANHWHGNVKAVRHRLSWQANWEYTRAILHLKETTWTPPLSLATLLARWMRERQLSPKLGLARLIALWRCAMRMRTIARHRRHKPYVSSRSLPSGSILL